LAERLVIRQNRRYQTEFLIPDPENPKSDEFQPIAHLHALTPYGMLLASVGGCTAVLLNSYAENHHVPLEEVEVRLEYRRDFNEDCENCERIERYEERIEEEILLFGDLDQGQRQKLFAISHQCSIHKILESGIEIHPELVELGSPQPAGQKRAGGSS
jgi:uncharacterized OsmC-like protein